ncbi:hypothetical protein HDA30_001347 [Micrococcus cohnii]|uniref:Uncharacterized protein n=1 Tax=Micrococcus cohnii TaxID=993416 RepID=A0A7W7GPD7_9MICC|nr:hypothetical protein [Micrococcus cohnii]MBB4735839.1 hypothetical protein [Micrococcus cohnii]
MTDETPTADVGEVAELCARLLDVLPPDDCALDRDIRARLEAFVAGVRAVSAPPE